MLHKKKCQKLEQKGYINSQLKKLPFTAPSGLSSLLETFCTFFIFNFLNMEKCKFYGSIYFYPQVPGDFRGIPEVVLLSKPNNMVQKGQNALVQTETENESEEQAEEMAELVLSDK